MHSTLKSERSEKKESRITETDRKSVDKFTRSSFHKSDSKPPMPNSVS